MDFRGESYSEVVEDIKVVIDTLGREKEGTQRILKQKKGAAYVSLQPRVLKVNINVFLELPAFDARAGPDRVVGPTRLTNI